MFPVFFALCHLHPTCVGCAAFSIEEKSTWETSNIKHLCDVSAAAIGTPPSHSITVIDKLVCFFLSEYLKQSSAHKPFFSSHSEVKWEGT